MKKALTMLAAALAFGLGAIATPASAAIPGPGTYNSVTCVTYADTSGQYPGNAHFLDCQTSSQRRNSVFGVPRGATAQANGDLNSGNVTYYFFETYQNYIDYFTGAGVNPSPLESISRTYGFTYTGASGTGTPYVVVFSQSSAGVHSQGFLRGITAHETGHQVDYLWRSYPTVPGATVSTSPKYLELLERDLWLLDNKFVGGSSSSTVPPCGSGGAFVGVYDPGRSQYICSGPGGTLNSDYPTGSNRDILAFVFPDYFNFGNWNAWINATSTPNAGAVITYDFYQPSLPSGHVSISYTVVPGDTPASIASSLATLIGAHPDLIGVHANVSTTNPQLIEIETPNFGSIYRITSTISNSAVLGSTMQPVGLGEFFAEQFVHVSGNRIANNDNRYYATIEAFIQSNFGCSNGLLSSLNIRGAEPGTPPGSGYSFTCTRPLPPSP